MSNIGRVGGNQGVSAETSQISNVPGLDGDANSCSDIWWINGNRCLYFLYFKAWYLPFGAKIS